MAAMAELPTGTVALLFSDVEGSTVLLSRLGAAYAEALDGQRQVLRKAWAEHGGIELGTEGDSFMVVFATAEGAVCHAERVVRRRSLPGLQVLDTTDFGRGPSRVPSTARSSARLSNGLALSRRAMV
jgi:class 3 adenylate cyclase